MRSLREWYRDEKDKLSDYDTRDRMLYIWQYYKLWIISIAAALTFVVYVLVIYVTVPGNIHFYAILSNTYAPLGEGSAFYKGFVESAGFDLNQGIVEIDCSNYCKPSGRATGNTYYEKLISMLDSGTADVWIAEAEDIAAIGAAGRLMDLSTEAAASLQERYADRFLEVEPLREEYSSQPVPIGIDLDGTVLTGPYSAYPNGAVLGINAYTSRMEAVEMFLQYLFEDVK